MSESGDDTATDAPGASKGFASLLNKLDARSFLKKLGGHKSPMVRWGALGLLALLVILALLGPIFDGRDTVDLLSSIPDYVRRLDVLPGTIKLSIIIISMLAFGLLCYIIGTAKNNGKKIILSLVAVLPLTAFILTFSTGLGYDEVAAKNIGVIANSPTSSAVFATARQHLQQEGNGDIAIYEYDLARSGTDPAELRRFIDQNHIKYLIITAALPPQDVDRLHRAFGDRGLTIITTPDSRGDLLADRAIGIFVSPEAEADRIKSYLVEKGASNFLLLYDRSETDLDTFENRFRSQLAQNSPITPNAFTLGDLRQGNPFLRDQLAAADNVVVVASGSEILDALRTVRSANPRARLVSTSRALDHSDVATLTGLRVETALPWPVIETFRRSAAQSSPSTGILPRPIETASRSAIRLAMTLERRFSNVRPHRLRAFLLENRHVFSRELEQVYGEASFADGAMPHLRVSSLVMSDLGRSPRISRRAR